MSIIIYIQLLNRKCYFYCEIVVISILPFSVLCEEKKCLLAINSLSNSPSLHSCVS